MDPKTNPADDSLISGMGTVAPNQSPQFTPQPAQPSVNLGVSTPSTDMAPSWTQSDQATASPTQNAYTAPVAPETPLAYAPNPSANIFNPNHDTPQQPEPITLPQPPQPVAPMVSDAVPAPQTTQQTSPLDPPPAPTSTGQVVPDATGLTTAMVSDKPKKGKMPVVLVILLLLVIIVLAVVGYLAYQNYNLTKSTDTSINQATLTPPTTDTSSNYITYKSTLLPIEFMIPGNWIVDESEDPELANQKMVKANSPDFAYQGSEIASGFEFRVGPVNDLTKKYDSFDAFAADENVDSSYTTKTINQTAWLVKGSEARTLLGSSPLTVALYTNSALSANGLEIFNKILDSFKFVSTPSAQPASPTAQPASPSAAPSN